MMIALIVDHGMVMDGRWLMMITVLAIYPRINDGLVQASTRRKHFHFRHLLQVRQMFPPQRRPEGCDTEPRCSTMKRSLDKINMSHGQYLDVQLGMITGK